MPRNKAQGDAQMEQGDVISLTDTDGYRNRLKAISKSPYTQKKTKIDINLSISMIS
jgi:hypothetical protein